jgi:guanylate kinase
MNQGKVVIFSGPSGVGKGTLLRHVLQTSDLPLVLSVSATTRPPREGEENGKDYFFLSEEEFQEKRRQDAFLECFKVFGNEHWYGTLAEPVRREIERGRWVVLEIDLKGARQVLNVYPDAITIFVRPKNTQVLQQRLRGRGTESEEALEQRLNQAREEIEQSDFYRHHVVNDDLPTAVREICRILNSHA